MFVSYNRYRMRLPAPDAFCTLNNEHYVQFPLFCRTTIFSLCVLQQRHIVYCVFMMICFDIYNLWLGQSALLVTRLHSSRMLTARLLTVSQHALRKRVSAQRGGCLPGGDVCPGGGVVCGSPQLWTEWQTGVKTLPCPDFVAGSNNTWIESFQGPFIQNVCVNIRT